MNDPKISELTVSELQKLIRQTVQEAVAEVMIEFNMMAQAEERLELEAAMTDYLRNTIQGPGYHDPLAPSKLDD
jgi:L-aminopeptidase/D-esterase-like protein